ncbi:hypothetical protein FB567DRAFT_617467 [Paraphoma chrysanthemicola]|uniref:Protein kinase domain-containing protein n=1 Tax=Paraphoma chrysanthemicola TaxID=798071 RepID=A0A8K0W096_9PLEO|nr:hypothetical protein FB567DRAFT_617467 [Paraphoma chrysanthemicola]
MFFPSDYDWLMATPIAEYTTTPYLPPAVQDLLSKISTIQRRCNDGRNGVLIPKAELRTYFEESNKLENLLEDLQIDNMFLSAVRNKCLIIFVILILLRQHDHIPKFADHDFLFDKRLPFVENDRGSWPVECHGFFGEFYKYQWAFCVKPWHEGSFTGDVFADAARFPISERNSLREGSNSSTFMIKLYTEYNHFQSKSDCFVQKICSLDHNKYYENEVTTYQLLMQQHDIKPNIVEFYGYFRYREELNMILEYANGGTLEQLFKTTPPNDTQFVSFWKNFSKVFVPLLRLHTIKHRSIDYEAIHQDIKPSNIIIHHANVSTTYDPVFKLIDFGFSRFQQRCPVNGDSIPDESGDQQYSAPEMCKSSGVLQRTQYYASYNIDTWSFGAVLSETIVWSVLGPSGIDRYRKKRESATKNHPRLNNAGYEGCFHDGKHVLREVKEMLVEAQNVAKRDSIALGIVSCMANLVNIMLEARLPRVSDINVRTSLESAFDFLRGPSYLNEVPKLMSPPTLPPGMQGERTTRWAQLVPSDKDEQSAELRSSSPMAPPPPRPSGRDPFASFIQGITAANAGPSSPKEVRFDPNIPALSPETARVSTTSPSRTQSVTGFPSLTIGAVLNQVILCKERKTVFTKSKTVRSALLRELDGYIDLAAKLSGRDQIFLFDNSESMLSHWLVPSGVVYTFEALAYLVKDFSPGGLQAYYGSAFEGLCKKNRDEIIKMITTIMPRPGRQSNMAGSFHYIWKDWWQKNCPRLGKSPSLKQTRKQRKVSITVFTDGLWKTSEGGFQGFGGVEKDIEEIFMTMFRSEVDPSTIGIQFIQFGQDPEGSKRLAHLQDKLRSNEISADIIDVEPSTGNVWKMLLGSFDRPATSQSPIPEAQRSVEAESPIATAKGKERERKRR